MPIIKLRLGSAKVDKPASQEPLAVICRTLQPTGQWAAEPCSGLVPGNADLAF